MKANDESIKHLKVDMRLASYPTEQLIQEILYRFKGETESHIISASLGNENLINLIPSLEQDTSSTGFAKYKFTFWTTNN